MSYKPDESTLISYLYEELEAKESEKVRAYLQAHPDELEQLQQMANVLGVMRNVTDKEVIAPPIFMDDAPRRSIWLNGTVKMILSIAASFLLLIVVGRLLGPEVRYSRGELTISFGGKPKDEMPAPAPQSPMLSQEQVQQMINASLAKNNESVTNTLAETQHKLDQAIKSNLAANSQKIDGLMKEAASASQEQVRLFVAGLQDENVKTMRQYLQLSSTEQSKYMEGLLVDFAKYLNAQRNQDLMLFQSRMTSIEQNTDQFKQETEQILSSIISSGGEVKKQSSY